MAFPNADHLTEQAIEAYGLGRLDATTAEDVHRHLEVCETCRCRVAEVTSDSFLGRLRDARKPTEVSTAAAYSRPADTINLIWEEPAGSPPPADTIPPGLADHPDYQIKRELGRGGMGVVYLAHHAMMGRDEVLKVMGSHVVGKRGVLERFQNEIRAVAKFRHPNIVAAYTAFRIEGGLVFAMEYVEGLDLSRLVKIKGPLPVAHAAYFAHQVALGLQHALDRGTIHRDIKPHNLMLTHEGKNRIVKVLDFGLAKASREEKVDSALTREGQALGTPDYIAPEQILDAATVDTRADIYSLGGTLFFLLTGRPPFKASSLYDLYQAHISRDADPLNLIRSEIPSELAALVAKMMAKAPERRFQTPGEVARALTPFFKGGKAEAGQSREGPTLADESQAPTETSRATSTTTEGSTPPPQPVGHEVGEHRTEELWASLITLDGKGQSEDAAPLVAKGASRSLDRKWPAIAASVLLVGLIVAWGAGAFKVKTREGVIVLEGLPAQAEVLVDGEKLTIHLPEGGSPLEITVPAGQRKLRVQKAGFAAFGEEVSVASGEKKAISIRLDPLPPPLYVGDIDVDQPVRMPAIGLQVPLVAPINLPPLDAAEWRKRGDGLEVWDVREGRGDAAKPGDTVKVHYTGWLADGTVFDHQREEPVEFPLRGVIQGWIEGVPGMKPGGVRRLLVPSTLGYGKKGAGKAIPPDATLVFEIELLDILPAGGILGKIDAVVANPATSPPESDSGGTSGRGLEGKKAGDLREDNGLKMKFRWCPKGKFRMGSPPGEVDRRDDEGPVDVTLSRGFWMGQFEVTQSQWKSGMGTTLREQNVKSNFQGIKGEGSDHPMYHVNHGEATDFCNRWTDSERGAGRLPASWEYRLPREAEWEYACRAGTTTATAFGAKLGSREANFNGTATYNGAEEGPYLNETAPVGRYPANAWNLQDMYGNIAEWCYDGYGNVLKGGTDPLGPDAAASRVLRGGSWYSGCGYSRSAKRSAVDSTYRDYYLGFRVALVPSGK